MLMCQISEQIKYFLKEEKEREKAPVGITIKRMLLSMIFHLWISGDMNTFAYSSCIAAPSKERDLQPWCCPRNWECWVCVPSKAMGGQGQPLLKLVLLCEFPLGIPG